MKHRLLFLALALLTLTACETGPPPLDAADRLRIDSTSAAQIRQVRSEIDSSCRGKRTTELPRLVDSIRQVRVREIQEKLKTIPR